jgi:hypothetical protein
MANRAVRDRAKAVIDALPEGWLVRFSPPTRTLDQSAKFHAMLADIVKAGFQHDGRQFDLEDLKTLMVSAWMIETGRRSDVVKGFAGEAVQLRRSTTTFSRQEMGELIDMVEAFAAQHGIRLGDRQ